MTKVDPLERLTNLLALLLETRTPLTLVEIADALRGQYPDGDTARRAAFERDKAMLRSEGVPIEMVVLGGDQAGQTGYRIDRATYELGDLGLTDAERRAIHAAVAAVRLGTSWGEEALWKVGTGEGSSPRDRAGVTALLPSLPALASFYDAITRRCVVSFGYRGSSRTLEPYGLLGRQGNWYLVGRDVERDQQRTFRVDRVEGSVALSAPDAFERPDGVDVREAFPADAKLLGLDGEVPPEAEVVVGAARAGVVERELGDESIIERRSDGSIVVRVPCANRVAFRSWVLGHLEHAVVIGPADERAAMIDWLRALSDGASS
jgi:proteasome accessory factor B